jgi:hypothetical protein
MNVLRLFLFLCVFTALAPQTVFAQNAQQDVVPGLLPADAPPPDPTAEQMDESLKVFDQCNGSTFITEQYDCQCLAAKFLDLRVRAPEKAQDLLIIEARKSCVNQPGVAGRAYTQCLSWYLTSRDDSEAFCSCYANDFAKRFADAPSNFLRVREHQITASLSACNVGAMTIDRLTRQKMIDDLKEQGLYDQLFPGANDDALPPLEEDSRR